MIYNFNICAWTFRTRLLAPRKAFEMDKKKLKQWKIISHRLRLTFCNFAMWKTLFYLDVFKRNGWSGNNWSECQSSTPRGRHNLQGFIDWVSHRTSFVYGLYVSSHLIRSDLQCLSIKAILQEPQISSTNVEFMHPTTIFAKHFALSVANFNLLPASVCVKLH